MTIVMEAGAPYRFAVDGRELVGRVQAVELPASDPRYTPVAELQRRRRAGDAEELARRARDGDARAAQLIAYLRLGHPLGWWMASHPDLVVVFDRPPVPRSSVSLERWRDRDPLTTLLRVGTVAIAAAEHDERVAAGADPFAATIDPPLGGG